MHYMINFGKFRGGSGGLVVETEFKALAQTHLLRLE